MEIKFVCGIVGAALIACGGSSFAEGASRRVFKPIQSIGYEIGSKKISGYFVKQESACAVTMMVIDAGSPEPSSTTAARIRFMLNPGQVGGIDSEEGRSINVTCGPDANMVIVDAGASSQLVPIHQRVATVNPQEE